MREGGEEYRRVEGRARLLVRVGLDALRAGATTRSRTGSGSTPRPGRLHRRVRRPDARLVLHADGALDGAVRPRARSRTASATASCSTRRARSSRSACKNYPDPDAGLRDATAPMPCAGSCAARRSCAAATCSIDKDGKAIAEVVRLVIHSDLERATASSRSARTPTGSGEGTRTDAKRRARPLRPREAARDARARDRARWTPTTSPAPAPRSARSSTRSTTGTSAAAGRASGGRTRIRTRSDAYDTLYTVLTTLCRMCAPFLPLVTRGGVSRADEREKRAPRRLAGGGEGCLRTAEPRAGRDRVRAVCSTVARAPRREAPAGSRQPLELDHRRQGRSTG